MEVTNPGNINQTWWHGAFDALLQGEFKNLKRLKITLLQVKIMYVRETYWDLYNHSGLERLRCQRGVAVDIISEWNPLLSDCRPVD